MKRLFDQRFVNNMMNSYQRHLYWNTYIFKGSVFFIFLYGVGVLTWGWLSIFLSIAMTVNVFTLLDIKRCVLSYRKNFYLWQAKENNHAV